MNKELQIKRLFLESGGVLTADELHNAGISYYFIRKLLNVGEIERIKRGVYRWKEAENDEWTEVQKMIPRGIFCLFSAAFLHELTTFVPSQYHVAIRWKDKMILPGYPPVKLYYWQEPQYDLGHAIIKRDGYKINSYDREKTVCDFIKFRNKVGIDIMKEIVKTYLAAKDRNLNKLMAYARQLGISSLVRSYLEVMV